MPQTAVGSISDALLSLRARLLCGFRRESVMAGYIHDEEFRSDHESDEASLDLETLAQHYGLPTRLLDWTNSVYVALFFAFGGQNETNLNRNTVTVWCLDNEKFKDGILKIQSALDSEAEDDAKLRGYYMRPDGIRVFERDLTLNPRVRQQRGWFSYMNREFEAFDAYVERNRSHFPDETVVKVRIRGSDQRDALIDLQHMGLTPSRMFGGLEGVAMEIKNRYVRFEWL